MKNFELEKGDEVVMPRRHCDKMMSKILKVSFTMKKQKTKSSLRLALRLHDNEGSQSITGTAIRIQ